MAGDSITGRKLKIGDIADLSGISERDLRELIQTYDSLFSYRTIGPVKIFPEGTVKIVKDLINLSERGFAPEEIIRAIRSGDIPDVSEEGEFKLECTGTPLPPEMAIDIQVMQETLARQERRITRLSTELEREREVRRREVEQLNDAIDDLKEQLSLIAEWVDYFDHQMDEIRRPMLERIRSAFGRGSSSG